MTTHVSPNAAFHAFLRDNEDVVRLMMGMEANELSFWFRNPKDQTFGMTACWMAGQNARGKRVEMGEAERAVITRSAHEQLALRAQWPHFVEELARLAAGLFAHKRHDPTLSLALDAVALKGVISWTAFVIVSDFNRPNSFETIVDTPEALDACAQAICEHLDGLSQT